jgi:hypothetical protein
MALDFTQRYLRDWPARTDPNPRGVLTPRRKIMLSALAFSTTTLFIRYHLFTYLYSISIFTNILAVQSTG